MSFLDNLENNLKALESLESGGIDDRKRREAERERAIASAPWADKLKHSAWVPKVMRDLTRAGFPRRMKVNFVWIDRALRLEALDQRLEIQPTPNGVEAVFSDHSVPVNLEGEPDALIQEWLTILDRRREELSALAAQHAAAEAEAAAREEAEDAAREAAEEARYAAETTREASEEESGALRY